MHLITMISAQRSPHNKDSRTHAMQGPKIWLKCLQRAAAKRLQHLLQQSKCCMCHTMWANNPCTTACLGVSVLCN
jgi:hypothetical protein